jgi:hypothetical protein
MPITIPNSQAKTAATIKDANPAINPKVMARKLIFILFCNSLRDNIVQSRYVDLPISRSFCHHHAFPASKAKPIVPP